MPLHPRTLIRDAAISKCMGLTPALANVHDWRVESYALDEVPALNIWTGDDEVESESTKTAPRELKRYLELGFTCALKQTDNFVAQHDGSIAAALDTFALVIEDLIAADYTLNDTASDVVLSRTPKITINDSGDQQLGVIELIFRVTYFRYAPADGPTNIFDYADVRYSLGNAVHPDNQAHDVLPDLYTP